MSPNAERHPPRARLDGIEFTPADDACLLYDPARQRMHSLNWTAMFVLRNCDGQADTAAIAARLQHAFALEAPPLGEVEACLRMLREAELVA